MVHLFKNLLSLLCARLYCRQWGRERVGEKIKILALVEFIIRRKEKRVFNSMRSRGKTFYKAEESISKESRVGFYKQKPE